MHVIYLNLLSNIVYNRERERERERETATRWKKLPFEGLLFAASRWTPEALLQTAAHTYRPSPSIICRFLSIQKKQPHNHFTYTHTFCNINCNKWRFCSTKGLNKVTRWGKVPVEQPELDAGSYWRPSDEYDWVAAASKRHENSIFFL